MGFFPLHSTTLLVKRQVQYRHFYTNVRSDEMLAGRLFALVQFLCFGTMASATASTTRNDLSSISFGKWPFVPNKVGPSTNQLTSSVSLQPSERKIQITVSSARKDQVDSTLSSNDAASPMIAQAITQPLIDESIWEELSGDEFQQNPDLVDALATTAVQVARNDGADDAWIDWQTNQQGNIDKGDICVWTGKSKNGAYRGSKIPIIKTRSIIPLSANEMVELMMDSSRVKTYNSWSIGRADRWVLDQHTKIVQNQVKPPIGSKLVVSTALLHARPIAKGSWVIVTRAVKGFDLPADAGVSEILLGVNLLEPIDESSCRLTAVNHVYSSSIPLMLAERLGVKSAVNFVKDLRRLKEEGKI